ncbi:hypothetical protein AVEN_174773-1 [Araneus ventricosus]|uniref:Uncharacterized protein n=1 Tax=Araneus ventricosus TaxID=182803 RepID=A0A4Y2BM84_ARAVE|nr:hypothetical protein AVEN_174773-1 [Araneus ventricosus]
MWRGSLDRDLLAQVSLSSFDQGSKLRCLSLKNPRRASKLDTNITKLNYDCRRTLDTNGFNLYQGRVQGGCWAILRSRRKDCHINARVPYHNFLIFYFGHGPFVTHLHRFDLCSHDRCVCGGKGDPDHFATDCPVTKPFHFVSPVLKTCRLGVKILFETKDS